MNSIHETHDERQLQPVGRKGKKLPIWSGKRQSEQRVNGQSPIMAMIIDNLQADGWFCQGRYEVTLDTGPRLRLPRAVSLALQAQKVCRLWCYPDPTGPRLILCPEKSRAMYTALAQSHFPAGMDQQLAYRKFICSAEPKEVGKRPHIGITSRLYDRFPVKVGETVVIIGVGQWYELWRLIDWDGGEGK